MWVYSPSLLRQAANKSRSLLPEPYFYPGARPLFVSWRAGRCDLLSSPSPREGRQTTAGWPDYQPAAARPAALRADGNAPPLPLS